MGQKNVFPKSLESTTWYSFLVPCRNSEKPNDPIPRKQHNTQQDGKMDRPIHGTLPATAGGLTSTAAADWHSKVKDIEYDVGLAKNYCLTMRMQKISWIYKLIP